MKTLIVEDDPTISLLIERYLRKFGETQLAHNGCKAIDLFEKAHQSGEPFDLICLDIMMPIMGGIEALIKIREHERSHYNNSTKSAKIIMITSLAKNELKNCDSDVASYDGYIVKPASKEIILKELVNLGLISKGVLA
jgi:two-component system, chemotaxis family, chemotaxis protein CheY